MSELPAAAPAPPKHLLIASYPDEDRAGQVLAQLSQAKATSNLGIEETAIIRREDDGKLTIKEQNDAGMGVSAAAGGVLGGLLGGIFGRGKSGAVFGALLGAGAAHVIDAGIPDERLKVIGASLPAGSSAVAAIVSEGAAAAVRAVMESQGGTVTDEPVQGGATVDIPKTGFSQIDLLAQQLGEAVQPYAGSAASTLSSAASATEDLAKQAGEQLSDAWKGISGGEADTPA